MSQDILNKALLDAVIGNHLDTVKSLLEQGADPNYSEDEAEIRPLHFAAIYNSPDVVPLLIMAGANTQALTEYNDTPLMIATRYGHLGVSESLQHLSDISEALKTEQ